MNILFFFVVFFFVVCFSHQCIGHRSTMGKCGIALRAHIRSSKWYYTAGVGDIQSHPNRSAAYTIPNRKQYTPGKFHILDIHTPLESLKAAGSHEGILQVLDRNPHHRSARLQCRPTRVAPTSPIRDREGGKHLRLDPTWQAVDVYRRG